LVQSNAYDVGPAKNWAQVFGDRPLMWFVPTLTVIGDGIEWEINIDESAMQAPPPPTANLGDEIV
jgi:hypothetical protein